MAHVGGPDRMATPVGILSGYMHETIGAHGLCGDHSLGFRV